MRPRAAYSEDSAGGILSTYTLTDSFDNKPVSDCNECRTASNSRIVEDVLSAASENLPTTTASPARLTRYPPYPLSLASVNKILMVTGEG